MPSVAFLWQKVRQFIGAKVAGSSTHAGFVFSPENIWDLQEASQRIPSLVFPLPPPACKAASHLHQNEELRERRHNVLAIFCQSHRDHFSRPFP